LSEPPAIPARRDGLLRHLAIAAALAVVLPHVLPGGFALSLLCRMGIAVVFALSFNMLMGQGGMMDFGHAVFLGLGGFLAMHAMRAADAGAFIPTPLLPVVGAAGGLGGFFPPLVLGFIRQRTGTFTFGFFLLSLFALLCLFVLLRARTRKITATATV